MIQRLICKYVGHLPRRTKVTRVDVYVDTGRQVTSIVVLAECVRCLESLL